VQKKPSTGIHVSSVLPTPEKFRLSNIELLVEGFDGFFSVEEAWLKVGSETIFLRMMMSCSLRYFNFLALVLPFCTSLIVLNVSVK